MTSMVRHHHECWDGTGYPDALSGEQIPLAARILCLADSFTALTSRRSHRKQYSTPEALEIMATEAGKKFDPTLFATFRMLVEASA
jgi:putative two-component system response regulator